MTPDAHELITAAVMLALAHADIDHIREPRKIAALIVKELEHTRGLVITTRGGR